MLDFSNVSGDGSTRGEGANRGSKLVVGGPPSRIVGCCPGNSSVHQGQFLIPARGIRSRSYSPLDVSLFSLVAR
jgi:hypothetical protein